MTWVSTKVLSLKVNDRVSLTWNEDDAYPFVVLRDLPSDTYDLDGSAPVTIDELEEIIKNVAIMAVKRHEEGWG